MARVAATPSIVSLMWATSLSVTAAGIVFQLELGHSVPSPRALAGAFGLSDALHTALALAVSRFSLASRRPQRFVKARAQIMAS
jgi:predicted Co/Zn/Cd cation transporter (cation efflux family)